MYSDVFRMYPRARVGKPSDTIKIQHARCEYKRILAHEGSMTLRYKVPYTIQARYKQDTVEYRCIPDVATPSGELCCVILIDLVGCDCSCDGGRLTGVMHFGYMRRTAMLVTCGVISW